MHASAIDIFFCVTSVLIRIYSGKMLNYIYYFVLRKLQVQDILIGVLTSENPLLNYLILIGKVYLWSCRRDIDSFVVKVNIKYETGKHICANNKTLKNKWISGLCNALFFADFI